MNDLMIFIYFVYGLSFCILGIALFLYPKSESKYNFTRDIHYIAAFAVLHAMNEWVDMFVLIYKPRSFLMLETTGMLLLPISFLFLVKFGINRIFTKSKVYPVLKHLPIVLFVVWGSIGLLNNHRFDLCNIWARYMLGSIGIFLTSFALVLEAHKFKIEKRLEISISLLFGAGAIFMYGIFSALIVPKADFFPASVINFTSFVDTFGIPVQLLRAACAVLIAFSLAYVLRIFHIEFREELRKNREDLIKTNESLEVSREMLRTLMAKMSLVEEHERKIISEELHDNIGQYLALSKIKVSTLRKSYPAVKNELDEIQELIKELIKYTRSLTYDLANPVLYQMGLGPAVKGLIESMSERHNLEIEFKQDENSINPDEEGSIILFRAIRELLTNIIKHAHATKATVSMNSNGKIIKVRIEDDGIGFDNSELETYSVEKQSMGLFNIRERIIYLGGSFNVDSKEGRGTKITIIVPEKNADR